MNRDPEDKSGQTLPLKQVAVKEAEGDGQREAAEGENKTESGKENSIIEGESKSEEQVNKVEAEADAKAAASNDPEQEKDVKPAGVAKKFVGFDDSDDIYGPDDAAFSFITDFSKVEGILRFLLKTAHDHNVKLRRMDAELKHLDAQVTEIRDATEQLQEQNAQLVRNLKMPDGRLIRDVMANNEQDFSRYFERFHDQVVRMDDLEKKVDEKADASSTCDVRQVEDLRQRLLETQDEIERQKKNVGALKDNMQHSQTKDEYARRQLAEVQRQMDDFSLSLESSLSRSEMAYFLQAMLKRHNAASAGVGPISRMDSQMDFLAKKGQGTPPGKGSNINNSNNSSNVSGDLPSAPVKTLGNVLQQAAKGSPRSDASSDGPIQHHVYERPSTTPGGVGTGVGRVISISDQPSQYTGDQTDVKKLVDQFVNVYGSGRPGSTGYGYHRLGSPGGGVGNRGPKHEEQDSNMDVYQLRTDLDKLQFLVNMKMYKHEVHELLSHKVGRKDLELILQDYVRKKDGDVKSGKAFSQEELPKSGAAGILGTISRPAGRSNAGARMLRSSSVTALPLQSLDDASDLARTAPINDMESGIPGTPPSGKTRLSRNGSVFNFSDQSTLVVNNNSPTRAKSPKPK